MEQQITNPTYLQQLRESYPTTNKSAGDRVSNQTIDWLVANQHCKALAAQVPQCYYGDVAPSEHWPVLAVYEI